MDSALADSDSLEQFRDIVGPAVSRNRLRDLLTRSGGSVQRAVDLYFGASESVNGVVELDEAAGPSASAAPGSTSPRPTRRVVTAAVNSPRHLADFVELSSSTDNDFDPDVPESDIEERDDDDDDDDGDDDFGSQNSGPDVARNHVQDWTTVEFALMRNAALRKGPSSIPCNKLPLTKYRPRSGHLSCSNLVDVPDKTVLDLKYPIHLGTFSMPLMEVKSGASSAAAKADCSCTFVAVQSAAWSPDGLPRHTLIPWTDAMQRSSWSYTGLVGIQLSAAASKGKKSVHAAAVGGDPKQWTSLGRLCWHLAELEEEGHIQVKGRLLPGPAHPEMVKAAALPESHKAQNPMHAEVDLFLLDKAVLANGQDINELTEVVKARSRGKKGQIAHTWAASARHMAPVLNWLMLADIAGLQIGPDCDGLLNFCDEEDSSNIIPADQAASALMQGAAEGSNGLLASEGKADHGPSGDLDNEQEEAAKGQAAPTQGPVSTKAAPMTVQQMLDSVALPDDSPSAIAPSSLRTVPKHFQLQGLHWMLARERQGDALGRGQLHLHPEWLQFITPDKQILHYHRLANHFSDALIPAPVGGTCGGFLCDEMGLGKTLQSLMLILSNPPPSSWPVQNLDKHNKTSHDKGEPVPIKTTLIVMPANLLQQWQDELCKHVQHGALQWCVYDGKADYLAVTQQQQQSKGKKAGSGSAAIPDPNRAQTRRTRSQRNPEAENGFVSLVKPIWCLDPVGQPVQMQQQDIALMTYEQLRKELGASDKCPLLQFGFWRVMLDEAQLVAATSSVAAQMTSSLWRRHAWVVTGTPITTRLDEIQGLLEFLAYEPFYHNEVWRALLQKPLLGSHPHAKTPLRSLMQGIMLRRTRAHVGDQLSLPPCEHIDKWVAISSVERSFYDRLHKQVISTQAQHQASQKSKRNTTSSRNPTSIAGRLVRQFTELRQSCCHPQIVRTSDSMLGKGRLSMQDIIARLTAKAYLEYDQAARAHATARLLQEAVATPPKHRPGGAYLEVMQQIMAAAQSAAQLEVEELIRDRASDGSLPSPALANGTPGDNPAAAVAAAAGSGLLKRKATDAEQDSSDTAEASAMPKAKRQKADDSLMTQMTEAEEGQGGTRADLARGPSAGHRLNDSSAAGTASEVEAFNAEEPGVTGGAAAAPCAGTETGAGGRTGTQAWHDQALPDHEIDHPGELETAPPRAGANAVSKPSQSGPSTAPPHQDTSLGPDQAGPSSAMPDQGAATGPGQPGPSTAVPDQATEGDVNPETKEKKEQARNRTRAWRKVLLDGLDLQAELTAAAASAGQADSDVAQAEAQVLEGESLQLRAELGLDPASGPLPEEAPRFSKRARQMAPETELGNDAAVHLQEAHAAHLRAAKLILKAYDDLKARKSKAAIATSAAASSHEALRNKWRTVQHMHHRQMEVTADVKGKSIAALPSNAVKADQGAEVVEQGDTNTCPICLDECAARTVTACGHYFCSACIHELVEGGQSGVPCPLCRSPLQSGDLYDAVTEEEAEEARQAASIQGDYGSKVSALLLELAAMKQADPTAKAVVFSSWSRLLRLVEEALHDNSIPYTSIAGAQADTRVAALRRFMTDPDCTILTVVMSTGGGAAGLTLTVASHVFLLEPNLNPGLEAQAAARVYRLGQTKPTRVIRLLTEGTIEKSILAYQRKKLQTPGQSHTGLHLQETELLAGNVLADLLAAHP